MLQSLLIRNFVLIDELHIDFASGLTVITGETGAGKSILLGAIGLLMGQRADSSTIRPGADRCVIEAQFGQIDEVVRQLLEAEEIDVDPEELIIRREISSKGKSRAFVNDTPAPLSLLKQLSEYLIDIHSQHKNLLLGDAHFQLSVLDLYSGNASLRAEYSEAYLRYRSARRRLEELKALQAQLLKEQDYLQFQYDQLEEAAIETRELEDLEQEEQQLSHAQDIKAGLVQAYQALDDEERGSMLGIHSALSALEGISSYLPAGEELYERLHSTKLELADLLHTIDAENDAVEDNPERLSEVVARLDLLNSLMQRHNVTSLADLLAVQVEIEQRLAQITDSNDEIEELESSLSALRSSAQGLADRLHAGRMEIAREVERQLIASLKELGMPFVRLFICIDKGERLGANGWDSVTFLFSANKDIEPEPVAEIASGGEISRLMLSIKALIADRRSLPTIIFDEIDTGVSGDIADKIGLILRQMGRSMQVMAVTHLPQIAAAGRQHIYIYKEHGESSTRSHLRQLDEVGRIEEIARMQSGSKLTELSLAAAKALLAQAQAEC